MGKIKAPFRKPAVDIMDRLDQFAEAVQVSVIEEPKPQYPWEQPGVRTDILKGM